jgi:hypothetical protein
MSVRIFSSILTMGAAVAVYFATAAPAFSGTQQPDCSEFQSVLALEARSETDAIVAQRAADQEKVWNAWKDSSAEVFRRYKSKQLDVSSISQCVTNEADREILEELLPQTFFQESLKILGQSHSPAIRALSDAIEKKTGGNHLVLFRLVGHFKEAVPPTNSLGGVQRGSGSIFMNFALIDPNEWLVILSHELLHSLDETLSSAIGRYSNSDEVSEFVSSSKSSSDPQALNSSERRDLDSWLTAGLDRGFLAEYRAWTVTFEIYQEGLAEGLWSNISWLDAILRKKPKEQSLSLFTLLYLDPAFPDPTDGIFSVKLIQSELSHVRQVIRTSAPPPSLGNIGELLGR